MSGSYWEFDGWFGRTSPEYIALIVDDGIGSEVDLLREQVVRMLRRALQYEIDVLNEEYPDPASWHPIDLSVIIVRPTAQDDVALVTPMAVPGLAWKSNQASEAAADSI